MSQMKIHYFSISTERDARPLQDIFTDLRNRDISQRTYTQSHIQIRLESIQPVTSQQRQYWLLRFSRLRDRNWPGVARPDREATDLVLEPNTLLSEDSYAIFDVLNGKLAIQYNHFGVRSSKIQDYINIMGGSPYYRFFPVFNQNILDTYRGKPIVTKVEAVIDDLSEADVHHFGGSSLAQSIQQSLEADAKKIEFSMSVDARFKENRLNKNVVSNFIDRMINRNEDRDSLKVSVRDDEDSAVEILDLFEDLKVSYIDPLVLTETAGRRYEAEGMNNALMLAMNAWH